MIFFYLVMCVSMLVMFSLVWVGMFSFPVAIVHVLAPLPLLCIIIRLEELFTRKRKEWDLTEPYWYAAQIGFFIWVQFGLSKRLHEYYASGTMPPTPEYTFLEGLGWALVGCVSGGLLCWGSIRLDRWHKKKKWREENEAKAEKQKMEIKARIEAGEENLRAYYQSLCADTDRKSRFRYS